MISHTGELCAGQLCAGLRKASLSAQEQGPHIECTSQHDSDAALPLNIVCDTEYGGFRERLKNQVEPMFCPT